MGWRRRRAAARPSPPAAHPPPPAASRRRPHPSHGASQAAACGSQAHLVVVVHCKNAGAGSRVEAGGRAPLARRHGAPPAQRHVAAGKGGMQGLRQRWKRPAWPLHAPALHPSAPAASQPLATPAALTAAWPRLRPGSWAGCRFVLAGAAAAPRRTARRRRPAGPAWLPSRAARQTCLQACPRPCQAARSRPHRRRLQSA